MLDKKQIQAIFLSSKWVVKQQRRLETSTTHLAQKLLTNVQCSGGSRSFAKEMRALKVRSTVTGHWTVMKTNWEPLSQLIKWKVAPELTVDHPMVVQYLKQIVKMRNLSKWVPHGLTQNWKSCCSEVSSLIVHNEPFLNRIVGCDKKWLVYDNQWWPARRLDWEAPKHFPKPNLHQKR